MTEFNDVLTSHGLLIFLWVGVTTYIIFARISSRFQVRILPILMLAVAGIFVAVIVSVATLFVLAISRDPRAMFSGWVKDPLGAFAYFVEMGIEFSILGLVSIVIVLIVHVLKRVRERSKIVSS